MVQNFLVCDGVVASARPANKSLLARDAKRALGILPDRMQMVDCSVKIALQ
jgi:hypothetical protein